MPIIATTLPNDGDTATASTVDTPLLAVLAVLNGFVDQDNLKPLGVATANLADGAVTAAKLADSAAAGWKSLSSLPNTITALGNRSYSVVFNGVDLTGLVSNGMRLRTTRTVAAPTQCTSLNGTTQYYSKTSPAGMTFTNNFVVSAWAKLSSYPPNTGGSIGTIASRYNGTSGWRLTVSTTGQVRLTGFNAGAVNYSEVLSYQSVPLNKWVHITGQLDMSTFTATTTTSYVMIDGVDVPCSVGRGGTNPTALIQAGNLEIGTDNATDFFPGKIAQVAIYSAKVTQATILASMHQTLSGSETSLISAYSFNGASGINDLNANANNLTPNGSALATNADSPYGGQADGTISSTVDYGIITKTAFSTNTTLTVQVPEGCTIPTSGGVSAVSYSTQKVPYGFPSQRGKWKVISFFEAQTITGQFANTSTVAPLIGTQLAIPIGEWRAGYRAWGLATHAGATALTARFALSTSTSAISNDELVTNLPSVSSSSTEVDGWVSTETDISLSSATNHYMVAQPANNTLTSCYLGTGSPARPYMMYAEPAYL